MCLIGVLFFLPEVSSEEFHPVSEKSKHLKNSQGYPDKYIEYFEAIEGLDQGYQPYPHGSRITEFQKAILRNTKQGKHSVQLDWVERGPGNVGGRTRAVVIDPSDPSGSTWYTASVGGGVWKAHRSVGISGQENVEWTPLTDHLPSLAATTLDISRSNPEIMYFGTGEGFLGCSRYSNGVGMFKTIDGGESWIHLDATTIVKNLNYPDDDWRCINRLAVHPNNPDIVVVVTNGGIFRTENGGRSFKKTYTSDHGWKTRVQDLKVNPENFDIQFAPARSVRYNAILRSTDGGKTWKESFSSFVYGAGRIELAISLSHPEVIWASVAGSGERIFEQGEARYSVSDLYRSTDGGDTWRFVDRTPDILSAFLHDQGWYDNAIMVHPFSPDTVYLGGVFRSKAWIDGNRTTSRLTGRLKSVTLPDFMELSYLHYREHYWAQGSIKLFLGYQHNDLNDDWVIRQYGVEDLDLEDMTSVEVRFGSGLTQMAHRYTVPPSGGDNGDGGSGIAFTEYIYEDYVEVPFQVWDTDNNRQLMVSFRDQEANGRWELYPPILTPIGEGSYAVTYESEYVFISKYDYDASSPKPEMAENGGFRNGLMYYYWPYLKRDLASTWNPNDPPSGILHINFIKENLVEEAYDIELWEKDYVHVDHHALISMPVDEGANEFYIMNGNDGGVAYSRDSGGNWTEGDDVSGYGGYNTSQFYDATKRPGVDMYIGGTQDNGTWVSPNDANSWRGWREVLGGDGFDVIWKGADSLMGSIQYNNVYRSLDGGENWQRAGNIRDFGGQFFTSLSWTPRSGEAVFSVSQAGPLRSLDFGESWHRIIPEEESSNWWYNSKVRVSLADPSVIWVGAYLSDAWSNFWGDHHPGLLRVSENALAPQGAGVSNPVTMRSVNTPEFAPAVQISGLGTHPTSRATAYVMFSVSCHPKLFRTEDMGQTWEDLSGFVNRFGHNCESSNGFPNTHVYDIEVFPDNPRVMWVGTALGIFESRDNGETWSYADYGLPAVSVWRIRIIDDQVILATHGRGVWTLDISQVNIDIERDITQVAESFELEENYPNPFNPTTSITFKVVYDSYIRITVFDVLGRKVATLTDQSYSSGTHKIQWDASAVSSGQYIYRMEADGKVIGAKSMVLIK
ncbi:MAG: T9SS type A sorting domain-containing protein [Bacteroidetes bacterium]|nr:T9SS type A sorting domain-containing protein [Bacteroidota bacterium]MCY4206055.1 T9SS type A sorting domain-containing protein [Bacteroidota bacterium]